METLATIEVVYGIAMLALGALVAILRDSIRDLFRRHEELEKTVELKHNEVTKAIAAASLDVAQKYIPREEISFQLRSIDQKLERLHEKLNEKVDKT